MAADVVLPDFVKPAPVVTKPARAFAPRWRRAQVVVARLVGGSFVLLALGCGAEEPPWIGFWGGYDGDAGVPGAPTAGEMAPGAWVDQPTVPIAGAAGTVVGMAGSGEAGTTAPDPAGSGTVAPTAPPMAFRITELMLRDPHLFYGSSDLTETPVLGQSVNRTLIPNQLTMDSDRDGFLDTSVILVMQPFDPRATNAMLTMVNGNCPVDTSKPCVPKPGSTVNATWALQNTLEGMCLAPVAGTTSNFQPPVAVPKAPCFSTTTGTTLALDLGGVSLPVMEAKLSATYQNQPSAALVGGLLMGFVTSQDAMAAILPRDLGAPIGGTPFLNYVRRQDRDQAESPNMQDGFWMYLNFVAKPVTYTP
jgi:hypothetical protein